MQLRDSLTAHRILAIARARSGEHLPPVLETLIEGGIRCLEVTLPTPGSLAAVSAARILFGDEICVGVGTVLTTAQARQAIDAGAEFLVSPHLDTDIVAEAGRNGVGVLPGVFTPTEAVLARRAGATAAKLFPASVLGPDYIAALRDPLPDVAFVPTGGVDLAHVRPWLRAGAVAVAVGSPLTGDALRGGDLASLRKRAAAFAAAAAGNGDA